MENLMWVGIAVVVVLLLLWAFSGKDSPYIGGGPSYRNWTSGASQRYATEFSGTNQGYPGNMATNVHMPTESEMRARFAGDEGLVGTYQDPNFIENNPAVAAAQRSYASNPANSWKFDLDEGALHQNLMNGENVKLRDVVAHEGSFLQQRLF